MAERPIFDFRARNGRTAMQLVRSRRQPLRERVIVSLVRLAALAFCALFWIICLRLLATWTS